MNLKEKLHKCIKEGLDPIVEELSKVYSQEPLKKRDREIILQYAAWSPYPKEMIKLVTDIFYIDLTDFGYCSVIVTYGDLHLVKHFYKKYRFDLHLNDLIAMEEKSPGTIMEREVYYFLQRKKFISNAILFSIAIPIVLFGYYMLGLL